ncbi:stalk domain-containing protein [Marinicrinis sediminis]|uniref:Stalk domain-containing protein n=1 Tax=Marinicrinis sediminis TaxID=1652465 RepID=A0ABW5RAC8_9BACL
MKKRGLFVIPIILAFTAGAYAKEGLDKIEAYLRPDFTIQVNGKKVELQEPPLVYQNRTYLPISRIGELLHSDVVWEGSTKTIYVSNMTSAPPTSIPDMTEYETIEASYFQGMVTSFSGRQYPVLTMHDMQYEMYVRATDLERLGVDIEGLQLVKESKTEQWYVRYAEAKTLMTSLDLQYPMQSGPLVSGEFNSEKIKLLQNYRPLAVIEVRQPDGSIRYEQQPGFGTIYYIDRVQNEENMYIAFLQSGMRYYTLKIELAQRENSDGQLEWYVNSSQSIMIRDESNTQTR